MTDDLIFHFVYSPGPNSDMRTFSVFRATDKAGNLEIYKFYHPVTGMNIGMTNFYRQNLETTVFEPAGAIEWISNENATIQFGIEEISIRDLRKAKKSSSQSRRFKAGGSVYKWKIADNEVDLYCVDSWGRTIATWTQEQLQLSVAARVEDILDRLVVTCLLNLWIRHLGQW
ncbi:hypothetical protein D9615_000230 [Tricholomella constricta]|uniref:DUF6593 domain-containing protein n=1 Tax=Tricholomella constricta TaxID=117010 RepID=A0A8H5HR53_9AGAR|nr:hypothetical protein D9615_000230 [Tricholomella constricta]